MPMTSSSNTQARISDAEPSARPGATLLRLRPSSGDTNPVRLSNIRMLTTGTAITAPRSFDGSSDCAMRMTASIGAYSVACTPDVRHSTGPSAAPLMMTTGNCIAPDAVSPIVMNPWARLPRSAATPRIRTAAFIERSSGDGSCDGSCDDCLGAACPDRAVCRGETTDPVVDLLRGRVAIRHAQVIFRVWDVCAREELAARKNRHAAVDGGTGEAIAVHAVR